MIIKSLHLFVGFLLSIAEIIDSRITFSYTSIHVLLVIDRFKLITLLTGVRLIPELGLSCPLAENTIVLGAAIDSIFLLFTIYVVMISFLPSKPRYQLTVSITPIIMFIPIIIGGGFLGFTCRTPPVIPCL